jgi:ferrous iron transport protein B
VTTTVDTVLIKKSQNQTVIKPKILLVGNPNVGKSVIFNKLTGVYQKVGNYSGVTLFYKYGKFKSESNVEIIDLPGIYSLASGTVQSKLTHEFLINKKPDIIINVIDPRKIHRNLALTLQLLEFNIPLILILTHKDKMKDTRILVDQLQSKLNLPVIAVNSHESDDFKQVNFVIQKELKSIRQHEHFKNVINHKKIELKLIEPILEPLEEQLSTPKIFLNTQQNHDTMIPNLRLSLIVGILGGINQLYLLPGWLQARVSVLINESYPTSEAKHKFQLDVLQEYYKQSEKLCESFKKFLPQKRLLSRLDNILLHPIYGIGIFLVSMFTIFSLTFILTSPITETLELLIEISSKIIKQNVPNELLASLLADGIIGGIGFVMIFIPQIFILFMLIAFLEHSGYLARAVFITDRFLEKIGISGTSIAPLLLGFGCNVPGVIATKSIADNNERIVVGLVNPFMSCSARLPIYVIIGTVMFSSYIGIVVTSIYLLGIIIAISMMYLLRKTILPGESQYLILELSDLRYPKLSVMLKEALRHTRRFIENAASWMALGILLVWLLSITGPTGYLGPQALENTEIMQNSWIYSIGAVLAPIFQPLGWDPRLIVALVLGFVAKEIVIGSLYLLYGVASGGLNVVIISSFNPVSAFAFMVFVLVYTPCIGTYFTLKSQLGIKWANLSVVFSLILAYLLAFVITVVGNLIFR